MLPHLRRLIPYEYRNYIEPFAGSACLFFELQPEHAVLSDLNGDLIETYGTVIEHHREIAERLAKLPKGELAYYRMRRLDEKNLNLVDRATRFIYLNRFCFNGLYRTNKSGAFNVPYGAPRTANVPTKEQLARSAELLSRARIEAGDFEAVVRRHAQPGDFIYLDPPFYRSGVRSIQYNAQSFGADDLKRLSNLLRELTARGCHFLVSYAHCPEAMKAFARFKVRHVLTRRNISGFPQHRQTVKEILVTSAYSNHCTARADL